MHTIKLDLESKSKVDLSKLEDIKKGDQYQVEITGINLNLYKVIVNGKDTITTSAMKFPGFGDFGLEAITALVGGVGSVVAKVSEVAAVLDKDTQALIESATNDKGLKELNNSIADHNKKNKMQPLTLLVYADLRENAITKRLNEFSADIGLKASSLLSSKTEIDNLLMKVQLRALELKAVKAPSTSTIDHATTLGEIQRLRTHLQAQQKGIADQQKEHAEYVAKDEVKKVIDANKDLKELNEKVTGGFGKLTSTVGDASMTIDATKSTALLETLQALEANAIHAYKSTPMLYTGGDATLNVSIVPLNPGANLQTYTNTFNFPLKNRTYVGVSAAFYGSGLYNDAFSTRSEQNISGADTSMVYYLVDEESVRNELGAAALFTYGAKFYDGGCFGAQFVVGPGISLTDKVRPRLLLGGGFSFGREHMVLVNGGVLAGYVDRRSAVFGEDGPHNGEPSTTTVAKLDGSWFVSLGYLFKF